MGVDRCLTYKGEIIASCGRAYHYADIDDMTGEDVYVELWRLIRLYDSDFEEFIIGIKQWVEDVKLIGKNDLIKYICMEDDMGEVNE